MIWIGIGLAVVSLLIVVFAKLDERYYAFAGILVGICMILIEVLGLSGLGTLLITLGILLCITTCYLSVKVVGGPWNFGYSPSLIILWIVYLFFLVVAPAGLIIYGISIL